MAALPTSSVLHAHCNHIMNSSSSPNSNNATCYSANCPKATAGGSGHSSTQHQNHHQNENRSKQANSNTSRSSSSNNNNATILASSPSASSTSPVSVSSDAGPVIALSTSLAINSIWEFTNVSVCQTVEDADKLTFCPKYKGTCTIVCSYDSQGVCIKIANGIILIKIN